MTLRAALGVLLTALALPGVARADVVIRAPERPATAIGADGTAAVTWLRLGPKAHAVMLAVRRPGGRFGVPLTIAQRRNASTYGQVHLEEPAVQVDAAGDVLVTWARMRPDYGPTAHSDSEVRELWSRWRSRDGRLSPASAVADARAIAQVVLSPAGRAWAVVGDWTGPPRLAVADPGGSFGSAFAVPDVGRDVRLAPTGDGGVFALFTDGAGGPGRLVQVRRDASVVRSVEVFQGGPYADAHLAARPGGGAVVTYARGPELRLVVVPSAGIAATTEVLPGTALGQRGVVALGAGGDDDVVVLWKRADNSAGTEAVIRAADGRYGPVTALGPAEPRNLNPTLAAFAEDGAVLAVTRHPHNDVSVATRRPGGQFVLGPTVTERGRGANSLSVAADGGRSLVAWADTPEGIGPPPSRSARLVVLDPGASGTARRVILDSAVADPRDPSAVFALSDIRPGRVDRARWLRLVLACRPINEDRCDATVRVRRSRPGPVVASRRVRARPFSTARVRIRLPRTVAREIRAGRRHVLWLTMSAARGRATVALRIGVRA